jgi:hypothetical protein
MQRSFLPAAMTALAVVTPALALEALKVGPIIERTFTAPAGGGQPADCYDLPLAPGQVVTVSVAATGLKPAVAQMAAGCKGEPRATATARTDVVRMDVTAEPGMTGIRVTSTGGQTGGYALQVKLKPAQLMAGVAVSGQFDNAEICYRVQPQGLWTVTTLTGDADAKLAVYDNPTCAGAPVASDTDDAAGGGTDARVVYRAVIMRDHSVKVSRWGVTPGRGYTLKLRTQMKPPT